MGQATRELRASGVSWGEVARRLQVSVPTAQRWSERIAEPPPPALLPIRVVEPATEAIVAVVSPSGWRIEGLTLSQARAFLAEQ
ncbi:MAG: hypothetical protein GY769_19815 [bacterium]|nr:hypothetical protein [bacterium]